MGEVTAVPETEKSSRDLEASHSGTLHIITDVAEEKIRVGGLVGVITESDEEHGTTRPGRREGGS